MTKKKENIKKYYFLNSKETYKVLITAIISSLVFTLHEAIIKGLLVKDISFTRLFFSDVFFNFLILFISIYGIYFYLNHNNLKDDTKITISFWVPFLIVIMYDLSLIAMLTYDNQSLVFLSMFTKFSAALYSVFYWIIYCYEDNPKKRTKK